MTTAAAPHHIPDILDCLAQLSNDEVPTPPKLARSMLDLLPDEVWREPTYRWLDPFSKSGIFLREAAARLLEGLAGWEPDFEKRRDHIYRAMLWGTSITEMTGLISRRTIYCSKDASGKHSVVRFKTHDGNLPFVPAEHEFDGKGRCTICGAPEDLERGRGRENYAYSFIHGAYPTKEMEGMKFDVIVGNPPYQLGSSGGESRGGFAMPLYDKFVEQAKELDPRFLVMITPSRWFAGGRNLDRFREQMRGDRRLRVLVDYPNADECFPGNEIKGGVSYFFWDRTYDGPCRVTTIREGSPIGDPADRFLDEYDVVVRYNLGVSVLEKVWPKGVQAAESLTAKVSPVQPFSLRTTFRGQDDLTGLDDPVKVYGNKRISYMERSEVPRNDLWIDQWKVLLSNAYGAGETFPHQITNKPILAEPGSVCTETYLVIDRFDDEAAARRFMAFVSTRFARFLVGLRKNTQHIYNERFKFVPDLPMDRDWTDDLLFEKYGLDPYEIEFIQAQVREMPVTDGS